ncbi:MAG: hypothetical protein GY756_21460 [bacterium]|nr:hypothetical protein [bacterium]
MELKFGDGLDKTNDTYVSVVYWTDDISTLYSDQLEEVEATLEGTDQKVKVYKLSNNHLKYKIERGYFFGGECWHYGTMITGDNNESIFIGATGATAYLFADICPRIGEAYCK